jgi:uncharacterized protein YndB with AHSA1/START domain
VNDRPDTQRRQSRWRWPSGLSTGPSLEVLKGVAAHEDINREAPVQAKVSIVINAPREKVWQTLSRPEHWHNWLPSIRSVGPVTHLKEQGVFSWKNGSMTITSEVVRVRHERAACWVGHAMGAKAVHCWRLEDVSSTSTLVETEESMDGLLIGWFFGPAKLHALLTMWLQHLKAECEK